MLQLSLRITAINALALLMSYTLCNNTFLAFIGAGLAVLLVEKVWDNIFLKNTRSFEHWAFVSAFLVGGVAYGVGVAKMLYYSQPILDINSIRDIEENYFSEEGYYFYITKSPLYVDTKHKGSYYYVTTDDEGDETEHYYEVYPMLDSIGNYTSVMLGFTTEKGWVNKEMGNDIYPYKTGTYRVVSDSDWKVAGNKLLDNLAFPICMGRLDCDAMRRGGSYKVIRHDLVDPYAKRLSYRTIATIFVIIANLIILIDGIVFINRMKRK